MRFNQLRRLVALHRRQSSGQDKGHSGEDVVLFLRLKSRDDSGGFEFVYELPRLRMREVADDIFRGDSADVVDVAERLLVGFEKRFYVAELRGLHLCRLRSDLTDSERVDESREPCGFGFFNRVNDIRSALFAHPVERDKFFYSQRIDVLDALHKPL